MDDGPSQSWSSVCSLQSSGRSLQSSLWPFYIVSTAVPGNLKNNLNAVLSNALFTHRKCLLIISGSEICCLIWGTLFSFTPPFFSGSHHFLCGLRKSCECQQTNPTEAEVWRFFFVLLAIERLEK